MAVSELSNESDFLYSVVIAVVLFFLGGDGFIFNSF